MAKPTTKAEFKDYCLDNKYSNHYFLIIEKAENRNWTRKSAGCYVESHHVLPKCIHGNDDTVFLTAKEHFICHLLLTKMLEGDYKSKMCWAAKRLFHSKKLNKKITSKIYTTLRSNLTHTPEERKKISERMKNRVVSNETRKRMSVAQKLIVRDLEIISKRMSDLHLGIPKSEEHKRKISQNNIGKQNMQGNKNPMFGRIGILSPHYGKTQTEEHKAKRLAKIKGRNQSEESKRLMSENRPKGPSGKKWFNNGIRESFGLPESKPSEYQFGRLKRDSK